MKKALILSALVLLSVSLKAQKTKLTDDVNGRLKQIEDKLDLKELVDNFSNLADKKDIVNQVLLFTEDATVETFVAGNRVANLKGRQEMQNAFTPFLAPFETVYHFNGQHTVVLNGDRATGVLYCTVTLIGNQNGKRMKTTMGVSYEDEYVRKNGKWLIAKRKSIFNWQDNEEMI